MEIDFPAVIAKFDSILERGLCHGVGRRDGQMCVEAAICAAMDLPHGDDPDCVAPAVRAFKIRLNDSSWSSPEARAKGLRDIGIAQIGSRGVVDEREFSTRLSERTIRVLVPALFREVFTGDSVAHMKCRAAADECEKAGTSEAVSAAAGAAVYAAEAAAADAAAAAGAAVYAAAYVAVDAAEDAAAAAAAAADAAYAARRVGGDKYLLLSASLALEVLRELNSPGCEWL